MSHGIFYLAVVAACLLWSAAFTAAAARSRPGWLRWLLLAAAVIVPPLALAPWVWISGWLLAMGLPTNWFAPTFTACISAIVGGAWIARAGLSPRVAPAAAAWPLFGLAATFVLAKAVAAGTLLFNANAVAAEGRMLRVEAAQMMAAALPPAPAADDNAAPLYLSVFSTLAADQTLNADTSPMRNPLAADPTAPDVAAILERHTAALDLLRRAADRPGCRFDRDWSRPSIDMLLPEVTEMRSAARLLSLAARRAAAAGDHAAALADIVRIHRLAVHVAGEPFLVSCLMGQAIDRLALETLADVLQRLGQDDLPLLDTDSIRDFVAMPIRLERAFFGEEAFGLATLADLADDSRGMWTPEFLRSLAREPQGELFDGPRSFLYRCFLLPADIAGYRRILRRRQTLHARQTISSPHTFVELMNEAAEIDDDLTSLRAGFFSGLMVPALAAAVSPRSRDEALHAAASVLVAATRARLAGGSVPDTLVPDVLPALPPDPFTADAALAVKRSDDGWLVYSVGPDGEDDGGPVPAGAEPVEGNDDVGLRLAVGPTAE